MKWACWAKWPSDDLPNQKKNQYKYLASWKRVKLKRQCITKRVWKHNGSLFGMTYITWKERQTIRSIFENNLNLKTEKYRIVNKRVFKQTLWYMSPLKEGLPEVKLFQKFKGVKLLVPKNNNRWEWETIMGACLELTRRRREWETIMAASFGMTFLQM